MPPRRAALESGQPFPEAANTATGHKLVGFGFVFSAVRFNVVGAAVLAGINFQIESVTRQLGTNVVNVMLQVLFQDGFRLFQLFLVLNAGQLRLFQGFGEEGNGSSHDVSPFGPRFRRVGRAVFLNS